jgi:hypothetical protein
MTREPEMVCLFHARQCEQLRDPCLPHDWPDDPDDPHGFPIPDDDSHWDVFIPDDDEIDPLPDPGDFWVEPDDQQGDVGAASRVALLTRSRPRLGRPTS